MCAPLLSKCHWHSPGPTVTFGNLVGSLFFGAILVKCTDAFSPRLTLRFGSLITSYRQWHHLDRTIPQLRADVCLVGTPSIYTLTDELTRTMMCRHKARDPEWHQIFLRGIGCNWLVCVAVWVYILLLLQDPAEPNSTSNSKH